MRAWSEMSTLRRFHSTLWNKKIEGNINSFITFAALMNISTDNRRMSGIRSRFSKMWKTSRFFKPKFVLLFVRLKNYPRFQKGKRWIQQTGKVLRVKIKPSVWHGTVKWAAVPSVYHVNGFVHANQAMAQCFVLRFSSAAMNPWTRCSRLIISD